jgi:hypothetical protein
MADRDVERIHGTEIFVGTLRRLADALEKGELSRARGVGRRGGAATALADGRRMTARAPPWSLTLLVALAIMPGCKKLELPQPPPLTLPSLPGSDGLGELIQVAGSRLSLDPTRRDPITAVGRCADLVTYCYQQGDRDLDVCVENARACASDEPWKEKDDCCPAGCLEEFTRARSAGEAGLEAFERVFFLEPDCFPGVRQALEQEP